MQRYFVPAESWLNDEVVITNTNAHHIIRVMRQKVGNELICNHPDGDAAICTITDMSHELVRAEITKWLDNDTELPVQVTIAQGLPKGSKLEWILQKGTELGAHEFCLIQADRSIAKWDHKKTSQRMKRYDKIMMEASEQCHRTIVPTIKQDIYTIKKLLECKEAYDVILYAYEEEAKSTNYSSLSTALEKIKPKDKVLIFIGPEGGFSAEEVQTLNEHNGMPVRLGKRILRTETASMYFLSSISYHFEECKA